MVMIVVAVLVGGLALLACAGFFGFSYLRVVQVQREAIRRQEAQMNLEQLGLQLQNASAKEEAKAREADLNAATEARNALEPLAEPPQGEAAATTNDEPIGSNDNKDTKP
jgi:hypothetical protein